MIKRIQSEKGGSRSLWTLFAIHYVTTNAVLYFLFLKNFHYFIY